MATQARRRETVPPEVRWGMIAEYRRLYQSQLAERIEIVRSGVNAVDAKMWLDMPTIGSLVLLKALDLPVATFNRKVKAKENLSKAESERVVGFARLLGQLESMVEGSGDLAEFDAKTWMSQWLTEPLPALGNVAPIDFMDTMEGQQLISQKLAQVASGAYA